MASIDRQKSGTSGGSERSRKPIKRRNRNFDPEMRILGNRIRTPEIKQSRGRSRSPVSKRIGDSIKGPTSPAGKSHIRNRSLSADSITLSNPNFTRNSQKVVRFRVSPEQPPDAYKDGGMTGVTAVKIHHPLLTTEPNSSRAMINGKRNSPPTRKATSDDSSGCVSPIFISQKLIRRKATNHLFEKVASLLRCGILEPDQDSYAINNAADIMNAASAEPKEIRSYIAESKENKRPNSILSKFPNAEAVVRNLVTSSSSRKNKTGTEPKLSSSQRSKVQSLMAQGDRHALSHNYEDAVKCYASLVEIYLLEGLSFSESEDGHAMMRAVQTLREYHHKYLTLVNSDDIFRMGREHEAAGRFVRAANYYSVALRIRRDIIGSTSHPSVVLLLNTMAALQSKRGLMEDAQSFLNLAKEIQHETNAGPISRAITERNIGATLEMSGEYAEALLHYNESFRLHRESRGVTWDAKEGKVKKTKSRGHGISGKVSKELGELLIEPVCNTKQGTESTGTWSPFQEEGIDISLESSINFYSVSLSETVIVKEEILKDIDADVDLAVTLYSIGRLLAQYFEKYLFATNAYINALYFMKKSLGSEHPNVAALYGSIGNVCMEREAYDRAYSFYESALQIEEKAFGENHPEVAVTIFNIGTAEFARGNYSEALAAFQRTIKIQRASFGVDSALVGLALHGKGEVAERMNLMPTALKSYQLAFEIDRVTLGNNHVELGHTLHKMGKIQYRHMKNYAAANSLCLMALEIYKSNTFQNQQSIVFDLQRDLGNIKALLLLNS